MYLLEKLKLLYAHDGGRNSNASSFSQSPQKWLHQHNIYEFDEILSKISSIPTTKSLRQKNLSKIRNILKIKIHKLILGDAYCEVCSMLHERLLPGWRGFTKTCSDICENKSHSMRQLGNNNTSHKMSVSTKERMKLTVSQKLKQKVLSGEFTPKSDNYKNFGMISFNFYGEIKSVRSTWELLFWVLHPNLEYEKIRLPYYDSKNKKERIYIVDFYDKKTNTLYEIKPSKYQYTLLDKIDSIKNTNYIYKIVSESYFENKVTSEVANFIKNNVLDYEKHFSKLLWITKKAQ